jgi:hypothetical protein
MPEDQRCDSHHKSVFQGGRLTSWFAEKHSFGQRHEIHREFFEDLMEEAGN